MKCSKDSSLSLLSIIFSLTVAVTMGSSFLDKYNDMPRAVFGNNYDPSVIPWNGDEPVAVNTSFKLEYISKLTETDQILTSVIWNSFVWYDERLTWNPADQHGIEIIRVPPQMIWTPDVMLQNSLGHSAYLSRLDPDSLVMVRHTGIVSWFPYHTAETYCAINALWFPFDTQTCHFWLYSWAYPSNLLLFSPQAVILPDLTPNSTEWKIVSTESMIDDSYELVLEDGSYNHVRHTVVMSRRTTFFHVVILTPCVILTLLTLLLFVLPVDTGNRMELGLAIWTSLVLFLLMVNDSIPSSSGLMPVLGMYIIVMLILISVSLIVAILGLRYHGKRKGDLPSGLRVLLYSWPVAIYGGRNEKDGGNRVTPLSTVSLQPSQSDTTSCAGEEKVAAADSDGEEERDDNGADEVSARLDKLSIIGQAVSVLVMCIVLSLYYTLE